MSTTPLPWYRTELTRWSFIATGTFLAVSFSPWGPHQWRHTPSLELLHTVMPWPLMSAALAVYTLLLLTGRLGCAVTADFLGLFLYLSEFIALLLKLDPNRPANPFAIGGVFLAGVFHLAAGRLAVYEMEGA
jgi:hypothetical protein